MSRSNAPNSNLIKTNSLIYERKRKNSATMDRESKQAKSNYYSILDIDDDFQCDEDQLKKFKDHIQVNSATNIQRVSNDNIMRESNSTNRENSTPLGSKQINENSQSKKQKIPPIHVFDIEPNELINFVKNCLKVEDFQIKENNNKERKKMTLYLTTIENYVRVKVHLQKINAKFFTFTPKIAKTKSFLLKGLSADTNVDDIGIELQKYENDNLKIVKVTNFTTAKSIKEGYILPIFIVQISSESNVKHLKAVRGLLYRCIRWEAIRKADIPQCRNCQSFFHSAANCFLERRCVKCDKTHDPGKCSIVNTNTDERNKLFCVLCKKHGHPASYRGCEMYKKLQEKLKNRQQQISQHKEQKYVKVNNNLSFANALKGNNNIAYNSNNVLDNNIFTELQNSIYNLSNQIINFQKQLQMQASRIDELYRILEP